MDFLELKRKEYEQKKILLEAKKKALSECLKFLNESETVDASIALLQLQATLEYTIPKLEKEVKELERILFK